MSFFQINGHKHMKDLGLVSIIIPAYNCENTIERCLRSIINQNYKDIEILLINDGSTDSTYKICCDYKNLDSRIRLFNQRNLGPSTARNLGLDMCSGEYVFFVDADDYIDDCVIATMVKNSKKYNADIVASNIRVCFDEKIIYPFSTKKDLFYSKRKDIISNYLTFRISTAIWGKLYIRKNIGETRFKNLRINEDFIFSWEVIKKTSLYIQLENSYYNYYANTKNSLTKRCFSNENMSLVEHANKVLLDTAKLFSSESIVYRLSENYRNACIVHNLLIYKNYIESCDDCCELYLKEKNLMFSLLRGVDSVQYGLLNNESGIKVNDIMKQVDEILLRRRVECS